MTNYVTTVVDPGGHPQTAPHYHPRSERRKCAHQVTGRCLRDEEAAGSNPATPTRKLQIRATLVAPRPSQRTTALLDCEVLT